VIQLYTAEGYHPDPDGEDGFAPNTDETPSEVEGVELKGVYADDAPRGVTVNKAPGDLVDIVHEISNSGNAYQNISLTVTVPDDWMFVRCYTRTAQSDLNPTEIETDSPNSGPYTVNSVTIGGKKTVQVGVRFRISGDSDIGAVTVSSEISPEQKKTVNIHIIKKAKAIIVTNRHRLYDIYGDENGETTALLQKLFIMAAGSRKRNEEQIKAVVYYADWYDEEIRDWDNLGEGLYSEKTYYENEKTKWLADNKVASTLDLLIEDRMASLTPPSLPGLPNKPQYLLIVGGDEILPFYRLTDAESEDCGAGNAFFPTALEKGYYFSDTPYTSHVRYDKAGNLPGVNSQKWTYPLDIGTAIYNVICGAGDSVDDYSRCTPYTVYSKSYTDSDRETLSIAETTALEEVRAFTATDTEMCAAAIAVYHKEADELTQQDERLLQNIMLLLNADWDALDHWEEKLYWTQSSVTDISSGRIVGASVADMMNLIDRGLRGVEGEDKMAFLSTSLSLDDGEQVIKELAIDIVGSIEELKKTLPKDFGIDEDHYQLAEQWKCDDLIDAVKGGAKYIFAGAHGCPGYIQRPRLRNPSEKESEEWCTPAYIDGRLLKNGEYPPMGYFIGALNCFGGLIQDSGDYKSSMAYEFIHAGASGYLGPTTMAWAKAEPITITDGERLGFGFSECLFDTFITSLASFGSVGEAYRKACNDIDLLRVIWLGNDVGYEMTVTEFVLYGIPWMQPNIASNTASGKKIGKSPSKSEKGYDIIMSAPRRTAEPASGETGGTFVRNFTFTVSDHSITEVEGEAGIQESGMLIIIPGGEMRGGNGYEIAPVLPLIGTELRLPRDVSRITLRMPGEGTTRSLGRMEMLLDNPCDPFYGCSPEPLRASGLFPRVNYMYATGWGDRCNTFGIHFVPVQHHMETGETTLWTEATLEVEYETGADIFVSDFETDRRDYLTTEAVTGTAVAENLTDADISGLTAVLRLDNYFGETLKTAEQTGITVPAGGSTEVTVTVENGMETEWYDAVFLLTDRDGSVLGGAYESVWILSDDITDMALIGDRTAFDAGEEISFRITAENHNPFPIEGLMMVEIYIGHEVFTIFADAANIPASSPSEEIIISGSTGNLAPGEYSALAVFVQPGKEDRIFRSDPAFTIKQENDLNCDFEVDLADVILALQLQVSETSPEICLSDTDGDGKIGLAEAVRILQLIAGNWELGIRN